MTTNTRTSNIKNNLIFNAVKFATQLLLQFVLRTCLIYIMGAEYLGLNGLFSNIFAFLNLAELGIGSAIVFSMYKPIADGDTEKVKSLQAMYKRFYLIITLIIAGLGVVVLPFLKYLINGDVSADINIYLLYILYLVNTLFGYFAAHKRSLLFAHQRNDVENKIATICMFGMTSMQIAVLFIFKNYYIYFVVNMIFTVLECVIVHMWANKLFPELRGKSAPLDKSTKKEIFKNVGAISLHKVGSAVVYSTDNILISSFLGLVLLGAYSNYYLIISTLTSVFILLNNALKGSVGNLIASADKEYVYERYKKINFLFSILTAFSTICMLVLFQPFISTWTKGDPIYLLEFSTVILLCVSFYIGKMRSGTGIFKECGGLFKQDQWKPIVESVVNLGASILFGIWWGLNGIILGTILSTVVAPLWVEPWVLYKHYFKKSVWEYFKTYIRDVLITIAVALACYFVCSFIPDGGILLLIAKFAVCVPLCGILLALCYAPTKEFKECLRWGLNIFKNRKNRTSK